MKFGWIFTHWNARGSLTFKTAYVFYFLRGHSKTMWTNFCLILTTYLQGISYWNVKSNLGLTDRNMLIGLCLKLSVWSWGLDIWVLSTNFQKSNIDWPQQPPIEKVLKFSKNFHDSVKIILVLRLLNSRTRITLKSSVVIFQALETSTASLTSVTSAASATSLASTASTAPFL